MLTNNVAEFRPAWWPLAPWAELFDDIVDSHQVGLRKPNPAIYRLALERLDAGAATTAFLDDVEANVSAATAVGMVGIHVVDDGLDAIAEVRRLAFH
jgi:putative hydrolase of the HAD superfamily